MSRDASPGAEQTQKKSTCGGLQADQRGHVLGTRRVPPSPVARWILRTKERRNPQINSAGVCQGAPAAAADAALDHRLACSGGARAEGIHPAARGFLVTIGKEGSCPRLAREVASCRHFLHSMAIFNVRVIGRYARVRERERENEVKATPATRSVREDEDAYQRP